MNNKYAMPLVVLAVGAFLFVAFFTFEPVSVNNDHIENVVKADVTTQQQPMYLFTQTAGAGTFENTSDDEYILTLTNVSPNVVYFSDRPVRDAGEFSIVRFLDELGFEIGDPPNAAIVMETEDGEEMTVVAELIQPIYDRDTRELIYKAIVLHDASGQLAEYGSSDVIPESFTKATLLIDGCSKKGDVFCGSSGKCINPDKEKCGGTSAGSWKKHKDQKCHGMKLEHAYDIASGDESECLVYDKAKLSDYDYRCDDSVGGWQIMMDVSIKGEPSKCDAYCIVVASEEEKTDEGVARVQYKCKDKEDEEEPKNKYCPKVDLSKGHDDKDAVQNLIEKYHNILEETKKHHTSYEHHYCITTGMSYDTKKHWATDCSGLGGFALFETLPYHYKLIDDDRSAHTKADRPLARDFYKFLDKQDTTHRDKNNQCWQKIEKLEDAKQGDFLVVAYDENADTNSTGHVMWIDEAPKKDGHGRYRVKVIDSANSGHGDDTRHNSNTYNCEDGKKCGIGRGDMWFDVNDEGHANFYRWSSKDGKKYCKYKDDEHCNCKHDKCELKGIVIGRALDCDATNK